MAHVVVCGGGFGGLPTARALRDRLDDDDEVTVVARDPDFFMGFAKLWGLAGYRPLQGGTRDLRRLSGLGIGYLEAEVTGLDPAALRVHTSAGAVDADGLIVALGAVPPQSHREWLAGRGCYDLYDHRNIDAIRRWLTTADAGQIVVAILGGPFKCPPAPYEAALIVDRLLRDRGVRDDFDIAVITPQPLTVPAAGVDASQFVASRLGEQGVVVRTEEVVVSVDHDRGEVVLSDDDPLPFDLLLGVPADAPIAAVSNSPLSDQDGWIRPDPHSFQTHFDRVYAVGDCTVVTTATGALPHAGVFAAAGGEVAAANLAADLGRGERARFDGRGYCFLELPEQQVAFVEGDFYADPPDVMLTEPTREQFDRKVAFEREYLDRWLP